MHLQPIYKKMKLFRNSNFPVSEYISNKGFYIPSGIGLTKNEQNRVIKNLYEIFFKTK